VHQDLSRTDLLRNLKSDEIFIQMDWAMKFLPVSGREDQSSWFGKRGLPWHITFVAANISGKMHHTSYVHVFSPMSQDSKAVTAILFDVLSRVKQSLPCAYKAYVLSDNAACYHSASTLVSTQAMTTRIGIHVKKWDFSEPQFGKGPCDRIAAQIKRQIRLYVAENHRCTNPSEFVKCATGHKGFNGITFMESSVVLPTSYKPIKLDKISTYYNFEFNKGFSNIKAWKAYNIGEGFNIKFDAVNPGNLPSIESQRTVSPKSPEQRISNSLQTWMPFVERESNDNEIENAAENVDEGKSSNKQTRPLKLFMCPEEGCLKSFFKDGNLQRHLLRGTHSFLPERTNLQDEAIQSYSNQLENIRNVPYFPEMQEALQVFYLPHDEVNRLEMGWALKEARNCKVLSANKKVFD